MVSVIIPTYNREDTIERSVRSVLNQTYQNLEVIVVDDASTDKTNEIVYKLQNEDKRIKYIRLSNNSGACIARNTGISNANGDIIAFQDSDDEWLPNKLKNQINALEANNADIVFCQFYKITKAKMEIVPDIKEGFVNRKSLLSDSQVSTQTIVAKKLCFDDIHFDPQFPRLQDYDVCVRLSENCNFYFLKQPLVKVYVQNDSISKDADKLIEASDKLETKYKKMIQKEKGMKFYIAKCRAVAYEQKKQNSIKERFYCILYKPSWLSIKKFLNSFLLEFKMLKEKSAE